LDIHLIAARRACDDDAGSLLAAGVPNSRGITHPDARAEHSHAHLHADTLADAHTHPHAERHRDAHTSPRHD
jgi:thiamine phosphate synthase YjbQ (UPF0047 family)